MFWGEGGHRGKAKAFYDLHMPIYSCIQPTFNLFFLKYYYYMFSNDLQNKFTLFVHNLYKKIVHLTFIVIPFYPRRLFFFFFFGFSDFNYVFLCLFIFFDTSFVTLILLLTLLSLLLLHLLSLVLLLLL